MYFNNCLDEDDESTVGPNSPQDRNRVLKRLDSALAHSENDKGNGASLEGLKLRINLYFGFYIQFSFNLTLTFDSYILNMNFQRFQTILRT